MAKRGEDDYDAYPDDWNKPFTEAISVSADDSRLENGISRAIWVGAAGDLEVELESGDQVTLAGVSAGTLIPIRVNKVLSSATTAGSILALY